MVKQKTCTCAVYVRAGACLEFIGIQDEFRQVFRVFVDSILKMADIFSVCKSLWRACHFSSSPRPPIRATGPGEDAAQRK